MYDALPEPSLKRMNKISKSAISVCTMVYLLVGYFGYVAFCDEDVSGDILMNLRPTFFSEAVKLGFVLSVAVSFPLVIFPCRAALHTLLCTKAGGTHDNFGAAPLIPDLHFKLITMAIVMGTLIVGILIPNIEFVLALTGATTGTMICYIFPALIFLNLLSLSSPNYKIVAQLVLFLGVSVLLTSTYMTLYGPKGVASQEGVLKVKIALPQDNPPAIIEEKVNGEDVAEALKDVLHKHGQEEGNRGDLAKENIVGPAGREELDSDKRQEPPIPHAPPDDIAVEKIQVKEVIPEAEQPPVKVDQGKSKDETEMDTKDEKVEKDHRNKSHVEEGDQTDEVTKKELKEKEFQQKEQKEKEELLESKLKDAEIAKDAAEAEAKHLFNELEMQRQEQKELIQQQKEIIHELKQHQQEAHKAVGDVKDPKELAEDIIEDKAGKQQQQAQEILEGPAAKILDNQQAQQHVVQIPQQLNIQGLQEQNVQDQQQQNVEGLQEQNVQDQQQQNVQGLQQQNVQDQQQQNVQGLQEQNVQDQQQQNMLGLQEQNVQDQQQQNVLGLQEQNVQDQQQQNMLGLQQQNVQDQQQQNMLGLQEQNVQGLQQQNVQDQQQQKLQGQKAGQPNSKNRVKQGDPFAENVQGQKSKLHYNEDIPELIMKRDNFQDHDIIQVENENIPHKQSHFKKEARIQAENINKNLDSPPNLNDILEDKFLRDVEKSRE